MAHFAEIDKDNIVTNVIVAEQDFIDKLPGRWIQTSYNTSMGEHKLGGVPLRKNYAGIGHTYDPVRDAFIPPKTFASWLLNEDTCAWEPPIPYPDDGKDYYWNEEQQAWILSRFN